MLDPSEVIAPPLYALQLIKAVPNSPVSSELLVIFRLYALIAPPLGLLFPVPVQLINLTVGSLLAESYTPLTVTCAAAAALIAPPLLAAPYCSVVPPLITKAPCAASISLRLPVSVDLSFRPSSVMPSSWKTASALLSLNNCSVPDVREMVQTVPSVPR